MPTGDSQTMLSALPVSELQKLNQQELKAAIVAAWKKHEEIAKQDLAPMLYWLRDKLRAQGARNDLTQDKDRGFAFWVEEHLDISRRTVDRWCDWYAVKEGLKADTTSGHLSKSDEELYEDILDTHKGKQQIYFGNYWVKKTVYVQYQKAMTHLQNAFGVKDSKEVVVRGVIYAASVIGKRRGSAKVTGNVSLSSTKPIPHRKSRKNTQGVGRVRTRVRTTYRARKNCTNLHASSRP